MSSFIDTAEVEISAGNGGDGLMSFRREKFVDRGGPDGGDGGDGGDVVAVASRNVNTLQSFRHKKRINAEEGQSGGPQKMHGRSGKDIEVLVPVGTIVRKDDEIVADLTEDGQTAVIAKGGKGGFGNAHFVSSVRQAPRVAEKGEQGESFIAQLELKILADVGLVGLPNAGKSTFLSVVSNARPEIADYPFTTLVPNLGVADIDDTSLLIADVPGLIEGASAGKGLGIDFLRHLERTAVLLHLIDAYDDDVVQSYKIIHQELKQYESIDLTQKPQVVALTKIEGLDDEIVADLLSQLQSVVAPETPLFAISAQAKVGLMPVLRTLTEYVATTRALEPEVDETAQSDIPVLTLDPEKIEWSVRRRKDDWIVRGAKIEGFARRTNFDDEWGEHRLRDIMRKMGILHELNRQGAIAGDVITFAGVKDTLTL